MRESFRQSMLLLHSWLGLSAGWILFFVFLTGTTGFVRAEIGRWMRPELPMVAGTPSASEALRVADNFLVQNGANAEFWSIAFPGQRENDELTVVWRETQRPSKRAVLDMSTGQPVQRTPRQTGGGHALYVMHYALHYMPRDAGVTFVGAGAMMMMISIFTGLVGHPSMKKDLTLRSGKGYARWRSCHTLLGVVALPFFLVMTWSGLTFSLFTYMPTAQAALFRDHEAMMRFNVEAYFPRDRSYKEADIVTPPSVGGLADVLSRAEALWGVGNVQGLRVENRGRANMRVTAFTQRADTKGEKRVAFDGTTGEPLSVNGPRTATAKILATLTGLHQAHFAAPYLRALYVACGLAGTALIGTGLVHWSMKRKARGVNRMHPRLGLALVDRLNLATVIGLPLALAAYFWANRLLPVGMENRGPWEVHTMFLVWGAAFFYAGLRAQAYAWREMSAVASLAYGFIPVLNALTTDRHLGITVPAGDWGLAGIDLAACAISFLFAALACLIWHRPPAATAAA